MRILVVEDNAVLAEGIAAVLRGAGYAVDVLDNGISADAALTADRFDLVILDLSLPEMDGLDVLRRMRGRGDETCVLILTARGSLSERILGLDRGADDYLTKPFEVAEFEARVRVLLRRQAGRSGALVSFGEISFDSNSRSVTAGGEPLELPARELSVLEVLLLRAGRVVAKQSLMQSLAAFDDDISENAVEQYVSRLRRRLAPHGVTVKVARGIGYFLDKGS